ncbi:MAG: hypothetical protein PCFJNLEI_00381 [Verrucomicrobiae bacterium]|nr:hypothetical protein [Verrucomicrobiae bacterium]
MVEDILECFRIHTLAVVAKANDQPVAFCIFNHGNFQLPRTSGERVHPNIEDVQ